MKCQGVGLLLTRSGVLGNEALENRKRYSEDKTSLKNSQVLWKHKNHRVADMMDLRDVETHYFVQAGLHQFRNPFIKGMAEKNHYQLGDEPAPIDVAFYIVPLINAVTRVGTMEEKTLLFESMLEWKAYDLIPSTKRGCQG